MIGVRHFTDIQATVATFEVVHREKTLPRRRVRRFHCLYSRGIRGIIRGGRMLGAANGISTPKAQGQIREPHPTDSRKPIRCISPLDPSRVIRQPPGGPANIAHVSIRRRQGRSSRRAAALGGIIRPRLSQVRPRAGIQPQIQREGDVWRAGEARTSLTVRGPKFNAVTRHFRGA